MKLKPVFTEKSIKAAKEGNYVFYVDVNLTKFQIRELVNEAFDVKVTKVKTITVAGEKKKNFKGRIKIIKTRKKAIVTLSEGDKIDIFEEKKKKSSKK